MKTSEFYCTEKFLKYVEQKHNRYYKHELTIVLINPPKTVYHLPDETVNAVDARLASDEEDYNYQVIYVVNADAIKVMKRDFVTAYRR